MHPSGVLPAYVSDAMWRLLRSTYLDARAGLGPDLLDGGAALADQLARL